MTPAESPSPSYPDALPVGTMLGEFAITKVIGVGGFGIVYMAHDTMLDRTVAIKEYYPVTIAGRANEDNSVLVRALLNFDAYTAGVQSFLQEARLQARFSHPAMLEVYRVWEQNATAYMAMRYYPGTSLRSLRLDPASALIFDEVAIRQITSPIFDALQLLHSQSVLHRDVSPDNVLMLPSGAPVLLDFGAARSVVAGAPQSLTTVLKPGYAPIEQYADDGAMEQGPWTDVYALGAVLHFLAVGSPPSQAVTRIMGGTLKAFEDGAAGRFSDVFIAAVKAALEVQGHNRPQSVAAFREALGWSASESEERLVSQLLTDHSFPSQLPHTATKTAKTRTTKTTGKASKTAAQTTQTATTVAPKPLPKTTVTVSEPTQLLASTVAQQKTSYRNDQTMVSELTLRLPASLPPTPPATAAPSRAKVIPALPAAKAKAKTKAERQRPVPKVQTPTIAEPSPHRVRLAVVAALLLATSAGVYVVYSRKAPVNPAPTAIQSQPGTAPATNPVPLKSTSPAVPESPPAEPPATALPAQPNPETAPETTRNRLDIPAETSPQAPVIAPEKPPIIVSPDTPKASVSPATAPPAQVPRASASRSEKRATMNPVESKDATSTSAPPKARANTAVTADAQARAEICGQILAKLSLGGADLTDSERNQLRGCR